MSAAQGDDHTHFQQLQEQVFQGYGQERYREVLDLLNALASHVNYPVEASHIHY